MVMEESRFTTLADELLERIADTVDEVLGDRIDVDLESGILTMTLQGGAQYVINKHGPMRQIWMSSPVSGASHFDCADGEWVHTRQPDSRFVEMLAGELHAKFGVKLEF